MKKKKLLLGVICILAAAVLYVARDGRMVSFIIGLAILYLIAFKLSNLLTAKKVAVIIKVMPDDKDKGCNHVKVSVKNQGFVPVFNCRVKVKVENLITGITEFCSWNVAIGPKGERRIEFNVKDSLCGAVVVSVEDICVCDFFGILIKSIQCKAEVITYFLPELKEIPVSVEDMSKYDMESFKYSATKKGNDSSETFGINIYKPGDSIKTIHWKLSGKMDDIVVRELGLPIENKLMVLIDKSDNGLENYTGERKSEATKLAASLSYTLARKGIHHHIGWHNERRKEFECFQIKEEADVWGFIPLLLASPFYKGGDSAAVKYIEAEVEKDFSNFALVSNGEVDIERLMNYGEVNLYRPEDFQ